MVPIAERAKWYVCVIHECVFTTRIIEVIDCLQSFNECNKLSTFMLRDTQTFFPLLLDQLEASSSVSDHLDHVSS